MRKLIVNKRFIIVFLLLVMTSLAFGQDGNSRTGSKLSGKGTEYFPYIIEDADDWKTFANESNAATYWASGVYVRMDASISVTSSVGTSSNPYKGNFDGNWNTLNLTLSGNKADYVAPFSYVESATIKNLTVSGDIKDPGSYSGGLIGCNVKDSNTTVTSCTSSVTISSNNAGSNDGGFVGHIVGSRVIFKYCIFNGTISGAKLTNCAGFVGSIEKGGYAKYEYCTMAYNEIFISSRFYTFHHNNGGAYFSEHSYYTKKGVEEEDIGQSGTQASESASGKNVIDKIYTYTSKATTTTYYVPSVDIDELSDDIIYGGSVNPILSYYGRPLVEGTDYSLDVNKEKGIVTIKSNNSNYSGKYEIAGIVVRDISTWSKLNSLLQTNDYKRIITLSQDYTAGADDPRLEVIGDATNTVILELNGHTIDRKLSAPSVQGQVMRVQSGAHLTIRNSATNEGKIKGGNARGNGGGIRCEGGNLVLENVNFSNNNSTREGNEWGEGGGIYCNGGSLTITGGLFERNITNGGGGAIYAENAPVIMNGVIVNNNQGQSKGAGVHLYPKNNRKCTINECIVSNNLLYLKDRDASDGAGIYVRNSGGDTVTINNCEITGNSAYRWGGGLYLLEGTLLIKNSLIEGNTSLGDDFNNNNQYGGGGIYIHNGTCTIDGSTITGNVSHDVGGVMVLQGTFNVQGNTIIEGNIGNAGKNNVYLNGSNNKINITGKLESTAKICVSRPGTGNLTSGLNGRGSLSNFERNNEYRLVLNSSGEIEMSKALYWSKRDPDEWKEYVYIKDNLHIDDLVIIDADADITDVYGKYDIEYGNNGAILIQSGKQLIYKGKPVHIEFRNKTTGSGNNHYKWNIISSPVDNPSLKTDMNLATALAEPYDFDLLYYDEPNHYWRTYTGENSATYFVNSRLETGHGYLYRTELDITNSIRGNINTGDIDVAVTAEASNLKGFNLIGNPYTHDIYKGSGCAIPNDILNAGYYTLTEIGEWVAQTDGTAIKAFQGILVQAGITGYVKMTNTTSKGSRSDDDIIKLTVSNSSYKDVTYAIFKEGVGLNKIDHMNADAPKIYISEEGENYAVATLGDEKRSFGLNFKAPTMGTYTLGYETEGEFDYLHVIDRYTGKDTDMLAEGEYTFIGSPKDGESRFIVSLSYDSDYDAGDVFAYNNGTEIMVSGEGELQVFDVMGRMVMNTYVNGVERFAVPNTGVYIMRLMGSEVKTQKMVVR